MNWKTKLLYLLIVGLTGHGLGLLDLQLGLSFMATWVFLRLYLGVIIFRSFIKIDYTNFVFMWAGEIKTWRGLLDKAFLWSIYIDLIMTVMLIFWSLVRV